MCDREWHTVVIALVCIALVVWSIVAMPIGRASMRSDLLKEGYRVGDMTGGNRNTPATGEGRWFIEVWRDGWERVER